MRSNYKNYMAEQTHERNETALESTLSRGHRREPKEIIDYLSEYCEPKTVELLKK